MAVRVVRITSWRDFLFIFLKNSPDTTNWCEDCNKPAWNVKVAAWFGSSWYKALHAELHRLYLCVSSDGHYWCMRSAMDRQGVRLAAFACREEYWSNWIRYLKPSWGCCSMTRLCRATFWLFTNWYCWTAWMNQAQSFCSVRQYKAP